jgi:hypothetical protein
MLVLLGVSACSGQALATPPAVSISYSESLDAACAFARGYKISPEWKEELKRNLGRFDDAWEKVGPILLRTTEAITGKPFTQKSVTARLTLCDLPSQSVLGVSVNMRYALASFTSNPVPMRYKAGVLYHEVLHKFLDEHMPARSALLDGHPRENSRVRDHLHLLALQKAVYLELGMKGELSEVVDIDSQLPDGSYKRAWEIVNQSADGYLKYVEELRGK